MLASKQVLLKNLKKSKYSLLSPNKQVSDENLQCTFFDFTLSGLVVLISDHHSVKAKFLLGSIENRTLFKINFQNYKNISFPSNI